MTSELLKSMDQECADQSEGNDQAIKHTFGRSKSLIRFVLSVITAIRLSTQRVWHTFNYDVTVSNGVNLCRPVNLQLPYISTFELAFYKCEGGALARLLCSSSSADSIAGGIVMMKKSMLKK